MPLGNGPKEEVRIQAMAFQQDLVNQQLLNRVVTPQYILLLGPALAVPNTDGSYHITEIEGLGVRRSYWPNSQRTTRIRIFDLAEMVEFIFKTADSSVCRTTFLIGDSYFNRTRTNNVQYDRENPPAGRSGRRGELSYRVP